MIKEIEENNIESLKTKELIAKKKETINLPTDKAVDAILDYKHPAAIVHFLGDEDFYFLINNIGIEDSLPLIALASNNQLEYILDLEIWNKDILDIKSMNSWIDIFYRAEPYLTTRWLMDKKTEFAEYFLYKNISVIIREEDQDPSDFEDGYFTFDDVFYIKPNDCDEFLQKLLQQMAKTDYGKYQNIIFESQSIIPAEYEEAEYYKRNNRLAEKGFAPFEEAIGVYQPLTKQQFWNQNKKRYSKSETKQGASLPSFYVADAIDGQSLFADSLMALDYREDLARLELEFAGLCNNVAVADQKKVKDKKSLEDIVKKVEGYISIGLQVLADSKDTEKFKSILLSYPLLSVFRIGYGEAAKLKSMADKWIEKSWFRKLSFPLSFWDEDWTAMLGGLLLKMPMFYAKDQGQPFFTDFSTLGQIKDCIKNFEKISWIDMLLDNMELSQGKKGAVKFLTYKKFILTLWARFYLDLSYIYEPIEKEKFKEFFSSLWEGNNTPKNIPNKISLSMKKNFMDFLSSKSGISNFDISQNIHDILEALFDELEQEYGMVSKEDLEPKYIRLFAVK